MKRFFASLVLVPILAVGCSGADADDDLAQGTAAITTTKLAPVAGNNNQTQINAALAKGGVVELKPGVYTISDTIKMASGSTLKGSPGAVIKLVGKANWPKNKAMIEGYSVSNVRITGLEIDGNGPNNTTSNGASTVCGKYFYTMIYFDGSKNIEVDHMNLHDNWNDILKFRLSDGVVFHHNVVRKEGHDVVYAIKSKNVWVYENDIKIACNSGIRPDGTKNIHIYDNVITRDGGGYAGIEVQGASTVWICNNNIYNTKGGPLVDLSKGDAKIYKSGCKPPPASLLARDEASPAASPAGRSDEEELPPCPTDEGDASATNDDDASQGE